MATTPSQSRNPFTSKRLTRRRVFGATAAGAAGLAGAVLVGCADDETPRQPTPGQPTGATGEPRRGGHLRVATVPATSLDPAFSLNTSENASTMATYDNLILEMHDLSLKPMLAEAWEPNEDITEYVLNLRRGVKFSHGKELKAEDVVFTFERLIDPDVGSPARSSLGSIESIEEIDEYTVRMRLNSPNAFLPTTLSLYQGRIIPSDIDPARLANETFGTGAYRLKEHLPGERTSFERNPEYWDDGKPYVDELTFVYMPDPIGRLEALRAGSVDVVFPLEPAQLRAVDGMPGASVSETPSAGYLNLAMHVDTPPFDDVRVRRAVQLVLDRDFVNEAALFGRGVAGNDHPIPPFDPHWWEGQEILGQDIDQARSLLEQAGHGRGLNLTLHTSTVTPGMVEFAVAFRELAAPAGLNVEIQRQPEDSYWSDVWLKEPFTTVGWNGRNADEALSIVYLSDADWNESRYQNPELDDLVGRARGLGDLEERKEAYGRVQQILIEDIPRPIPVFLPIFAAHRDRVGGLAAHPNNWLLLHEAWLADA